MLCQKWNHISYQLQSFPVVWNLSKLTCGKVSTLGESLSVVIMWFQHSYLHHCHQISLSIQSLADQTVLLNVESVFLYYAVQCTFCCTTLQMAVGTSSSPVLCLLRQILQLHRSVITMMSAPEALQACCRATWLWLSARGDTLQYQSDRLCQYDQASYCDHIRMWLKAKCWCFIVNKKNINFSRKRLWKPG